MALFGGGWKGLDLTPGLRTASRVLDPGGLASGRNKRSIASPSYVGRRLFDPAEIRFQENTQEAPPPPTWRQQLMDRADGQGQGYSSAPAPAQQNRLLDTSGGGNPFAQRAQQMGLKDYQGMSKQRQMAKALRG